MAKRRKKIFNFHISFWTFNILALIILIFLFANIIVNSKTNALLNEKIAQAEELSRPADIDIIVLKDSPCDDCFNVEQLIDVIKKENVKVNSEKILEINTQEARDLINNFNIDKAPTFIVVGEIEKNAALKNWWPKVGEVKDNTFVFRQAVAPYKEISTGEVRGRAKLIMLVDIDCTDCYDITQHEIILSRLGFPAQNQEIVDSISNQGGELINKYKITMLPTIILTGDINAYPAIKSVWGQVGTIEQDGAYVFRQGVKQMGAYKDLTTGEVVKPVNN